MSAKHEYRPVYQTSLVDPTEFWARAAEAVDWVDPHAPADSADTAHSVAPASVPGTIVDAGAKPLARWFPEARLNTCYNALDRHVAAGRGELPALIHDSAMTGVRRVRTYRELLDEVATFAGAMRALGVDTGDRVIIYMPMIPEAVVAMLACARIGAVHSVVFGGFAAPELAARIDDAEPVLIVTASGGIEPNRRIEYPPIVRHALELTTTTAPRTVVVRQRARFSGLDFDELSAPRDTGARVRWLDWDDAVDGAEPADPVPVAATDPLYILYTSGTTGKPKGVVRDNGGHAVALTWSMRDIYDVGPGQVMWAASDVGWVVGHSYIVYAPLLVGATSLLYEGKPVGTPDAGAFWRIVAEHRVRVLFTAPTALRAIRKADPEAGFARQHDLSSLRALFCAGERLDPATYTWAREVLLADHPDCPVVDHWWQTETGWPIAANPLGLQELPAKPGSASVPVPGYRIRVLDAEGNPVPPGTEGNIVIGLPLPPGTLTGLWRDEARLTRSYLKAFPGHYLTGDSGYVDDDGYLFVLGRSDDVINMAGHRLSAGSLEAAIAGHPAVAECAVVGLPDELKGQRPLAYVVLKEGALIEPDLLRAELVERVREQVGAIATLHDAIVVAGLPKTRSGKILRKSIRQISAGEEYEIPSTIEDPAVLVALADQILSGRTPIAPVRDVASSEDADTDTPI